MIFAVTCFAVDAPATAPSKDGAILSVISTVDNNEIAAANSVNEKNTNAAVKDYANMMLKFHNQNVQDAATLAKDLNLQIQDNKKTLALKIKGEKELKKLNSLSGADFDKAYMAAMVKDHAKILKLIDKLSAKATDAKVKAFLADTKTQVAEHLEAAKKVDAALK